MAYDPRKPITVSNCPTRHALERTPLIDGFLKQSIGARHTQKKRDNHARNLQTRQGGGK